MQSNAEGLHELVSGRQVQYCGSADKRNHRYPPPPGTPGTIKHVGPTEVFVRWDTGISDFYSADQLVLVTTDAAQAPSAGFIKSTPPSHVYTMDRSQTSVAEAPLATVTALPPDAHQTSRPMAGFPADSEHSEATEPRPSSTTIPASATPHHSAGSAFMPADNTDAPVAVATESSISSSSHTPPSPSHPLTAPIKVHGAVAPNPMRRPLIATIKRVSSTSTHPSDSVLNRITPTFSHTPNFIVGQHKVPTTPTAPAATVNAHTVLTTVPTTPTALASTVNAHTVSTPCPAVGAKSSGDTSPATYRVVSAHAVAAAATEQYITASGDTSAATCRVAAATGNRIVGGGVNGLATATSTTALNADFIDTMPQPNASSAVATLTAHHVSSVDPVAANKASSALATTTATAAHQLASTDNVSAPHSGENFGLNTAASMHFGTSEQWGLAESLTEHLHATGKHKTPAVDSSTQSAASVKSPPLEAIPTHPNPTTSYAPECTDDDAVEVSAAASEPRCITDVYEVAATTSLKCPRTDIANQHPAVANAHAVSVAATASRHEVRVNGVPAIASATHPAAHTANSTPATGGAPFHVDSADTVSASATVLHDTTDLNGTHTASPAMQLAGVCVKSPPATATSPLPADSAIKVSAIGAASCVVPEVKTVSASSSEQCVNGGVVDENLAAATAPEAENASALHPYVSLKSAPALEAPPKHEQENPTHSVFTPTSSSSPTPTSTPSAHAHSCCDRENASESQLQAHPVRTDGDQLDATTDFTLPTTAQPMEVEYTTAVDVLITGLPFHSSMPFEKLHALLSQNGRVVKITYPSDTPTSACVSMACSEDAMAVVTNLHGAKPFPALSLTVLQAVEALRACVPVRIHGLPSQISTADLCSVVSPLGTVLKVIYPAGEPDTAKVYMGTAAEAARVASCLNGQMLAASSAALQVVWLPSEREGEEEGVGAAMQAYNIEAVRAKGEEGAIVAGMGTSAPSEQGERDREYCNMSALPSDVQHLAPCTATVVFSEGLPFHTDEAMMRELLDVFGDVVACDVCENDCRVTATVTLASEDAAIEVVKCLDGMRIPGCSKALVVEFLPSQPKVVSGSDIDSQALLDVGDYVRLAPGCQNNKGPLQPGMKGRIVMVDAEGTGAYYVESDDGQQFWYDAAALRCWDDSKGTNARNQRAAFLQEASASPPLDDPGSSEPVQEARICAAEPADSASHGLCESKCCLTLEPNATSASCSVLISGLPPLFTTAQNLRELLTRLGCVVHVTYPAGSPGTATAIMSSAPEAESLVKVLHGQTVAGSPTPLQVVVLPPNYATSPWWMAQAQACPSPDAPAFPPPLQQPDFRDTFSAVLPPSYEYGGPLVRGPVLSRNGENSNGPGAAILAPMDQGGGQQPVHRIAPSPTPSVALHISGLPGHNVDSVSLQAMLSAQGLQPTHITYPADSLTSAWVAMPTMQEAERAVALLHDKQIEGSPSRLQVTMHPLARMQLITQRLQSGVAPPDSASARQSVYNVNQHASNVNPSEASASTSILISTGLPAGADATSVRALVGAYGPVLDCNICTSHCGLTAMVVMATEEHAYNVVENLHGRRVIGSDVPLTVTKGPKKYATCDVEPTQPCPWSSVFAGCTGTYNVLVIGETGAGKSTLINMLTNYFRGGELTPKGIKIAIPNRIYPASTEGYAHSEAALEDGASSQTQECMVYAFANPAKTITVNLIDSPGLGDTQGIEADEETLRQLLEIAARMGSLSAVMLVVNGSVARSLQGVTWVMQRLRSSLPDALIANMIAVFTMTDSKHTCNADIKSLPFNIQDDRCFFMQNSAFSVDLHSCNSQTRELTKARWSHAMQTCADIALCVRNLDNVCTSGVLQLQKSRDEVKAMLHEVTLKIRNLQDLHARIEEAEERHRDAADKQSQYINFSAFQTITQYTLVDAPYHSTICSCCNYVCHDHCLLVEIDMRKRNQFVNCAAFAGQDKCMVCPRRCSYNTHYHGRKTMARTSITVHQVLEDVKAKYDTAKDKAHTANKELRSFQDALRTVEGAITQQLSALADTCQQLVFVCRSFNLADELHATIEQLVRDSRCAGSPYSVRVYNDVIAALRGIADEQCH